MTQRALPSTEHLKRQFSPVFLILANMLPLVGVLAWDWDVASVVIFYWSENLIIGFYNLLKLMSKGFAPVDNGRGKAWFMSVFFVAHYGGFCAAHGFFVLELFELETGPVATGADWPGPLMVFQLISEAAQGVLAISPSYWLWGFGAMFISHGFSFISNWLLAGEHQRKTVDQLMVEPYKRIFVLHIVVIVGGLGIQALGSPLPLLLLLIALKIGLDLRAHKAEHQLTWQQLMPFGLGSEDSVTHQQQ